MNTPISGQITMPAMAAQPGNLPLDNRDGGRYSLKIQA